MDELRKVGLKGKRPSPGSRLGLGSPARSKGVKTSWLSQLWRESFSEIGFTTCILSGWSCHSCHWLRASYRDHNDGGHNKFTHLLRRHELSAMLNT